MKLPDVFQDRDRWIVGTCLTILCLLAWFWLVRDAALMTAQPAMSMPGMDMAMPGMAMPGSAAPGPFTVWREAFVMWLVMMVAMMLPSAGPMILLYARAMRYAQGTGQLGKGVVPAAAFATGYLLTWLGFSLVATLLQRGLEASGGISAMWMASKNWRAASPGSILAHTMR